MSNLLFLAIAGAIGTLSRYFVGLAANRFLGADFPFGTLLVNTLGCLLIGFVAEAGLSSELLPKASRLPVTIGFLGAFTTFSTFSYETIKYLDSGAWQMAMLNIGSNLGLCVIATIAGVMMGRAFLGNA